MDLSKVAPPQPPLRVRALLLPVAVGTFVAWLALGGVISLGCASGVLRCRGDANQPLTGLPGFLSTFALFAAIGAVAALIGCLGLPVAIRFYEWRQRASAAAANRDAAA